MATGSTLGTLLATTQAKVVAAAIAGTLVLGGGAATLAATGAIHSAGKSTTGNASHTPSAQATGGAAGAAARQQACTQHNGDAEQLASVYGPMFAGDKTSARDEICTLFVGSDGHAFGFGEVQQVLDLAATLESRGGDTACLTHPLSSGHGDAGSAAVTIPTQKTPGATMALVAKILQAAQSSPLEKLAMNCDVPQRPASSNTGAGQGKPTQTPGAKPTGTPGHRP